MENKDKWSGTNPWLGLASYTEGTPLYGRDKETIVLADIIKNNLATIVFGKSGVGKSSLLGAGISPALREELYIPIKIRLVHNSDLTYTDQIEEEVRKQVCCTDRLPASVPSLGLWDFFHRHNFTRLEDGEECVPVIILDQFEEIYTLTDDDHKLCIHSFFLELSSLLNDIKPDHVVEKERKYVSAEPATVPVGSAKLKIRRVASFAFAYNTDINFRFVICLREDKLYLLERNSVNIPALKTNRFNLQALSVDSALEVIMCPRPDLFTAAEAAAIIDKLADMGDEGVRTLDPAILSLFLYKYYEKQGTANADNIFADYYGEATAAISSKSIAFLENHLLTLGGYRNQIPLDDALSSGVTQSEIDLLLGSVILRTEKRKGIDYIEFSHDRLCVEAKKNREERNMREQARKARKRMLLSFFVFAISVGILAYVFWQKHQLAIEKEATQKEKAGRLTAEVANDSITRLNNEKELQLHLNELQRDSIEELNKDLSNEKETLNHTLIERERHIAIIERQQREIEALMSGVEVDSMCITNNKPGQLSKELPLATLTKLSKLTISGELNGSDLYHLSAAFKSNLRYLNLRDAKILAGGIPYYDDFKTENNVIGRGLFSYSNSLENVIIPNGVTAIGSSAFRNSYNLTSVNIPNSVTTIGSSAFHGCSSLTSANIPNSVTSIGHDAFFLCSSLRSVNLPNSITSLEYSAFHGCSSLTSIIIPNSVTLIESSAFRDCISLNTINIPNSVTSIGKYAFKGCSSLTSIIIPEGVTSISDYAFYGCSGLTSINIPEGVTSISDYAFYGCSGLTSINIPNSVASIGKYAFSRCSALTHIKSEIKDIKKCKGVESAFTNIPPTCTWHVPTGKLQEYTSRPWWVKTWDIVDDLR